MRRKIATTALATAFVMAVAVSPASAGHDHYVVTPNGNCHQVAQGQTAIEDAGHGGYHQFHDHVHTGAAAPDNETLGHGNARVKVYKSADAPSVCFG